MGLDCLPKLFSWLLAELMPVDQLNEGVPTMRCVSRDRVTETSLLRFARVSGLDSGFESMLSGFRFFVSSSLSAARIARRRFAAGSSGELSSTCMTSGDDGGGVAAIVCYEEGCQQPELLTSS